MIIIQIQNSVHTSLNDITESPKIQNTTSHNLHEQIFRPLYPQQSSWLLTTTTSIHHAFLSWSNDVLDVSISDTFEEWGNKMWGGKLVLFLLVVLLYLHVFEPKFRNVLAWFSELYNTFANRCDLSRQSKILINRHWFRLTDLRC